MANALDGTQPVPEGEPVVTGTETAPEQTNDELDNDNLEGGAGQEGDGQPEGNGADEGAEPEKPVKPEEKKKQPWELRRIAELTGKQREAERKLAEAEAKLAQFEAGQAPNPDDDVERRVNRQAEQIVKQRELQSRVNTWANAGETEYGKAEFAERCNFLANLMDDHTRNEFMDTLTDPDQVSDGHKVIMELASDPEEAERILALPPKKMALALAKISDKLAKPAAPAPKPLSKAPAPVAPIGGATARVSDRLEDPNIPMDVFADKFLKEMAQKAR